MGILVDYIGQDQAFEVSVKVQVVGVGNVYPKSMAFELKKAESAGYVVLGVGGDATGYLDRR